MRIGYACVNTALAPLKNKTFRLASYSTERLIETLQNNLGYLEQALLYNREHDIKFFRISSDLVPFASHEVCTYDWADHFKARFDVIGTFIKKEGMRISMHPDQFVLINSPSKEIVERSVAELVYHAKVFDALGLDHTHKIQIHVGGAYGNPKESISRFIGAYTTLPQDVSKRLAIENDERLFSLKDCLFISGKTGIPIIFDVFHHECLNNRESPEEALESASRTWKGHGKPMIDYSSQDPLKRFGAHAQSVDIEHFKRWKPLFEAYECDVMLEVKDKQESVHAIMSHGM